MNPFIMNPLSLLYLSGIEKKFIIINDTVLIQMDLHPDTQHLNMHHVLISNYILDLYPINQLHIVCEHLD